MSSSSHNYQNINELFGKYINIQKLSQKLEKKKYIVTIKKKFLDGTRTFSFGHQV